MTPQKIRRVCAYIVLALAIITLFTASLTLGRYSGEINSTGTYPGDMEFIVSDQIEVFSEEQFFSAIENGYSNIKIADEVESPIVITGSMGNVHSDLTIDLNGHELQRNNREPLLNVQAGVNLTIIDSSDKQTGCFYNPVGSVITVSGGTLTTQSGIFESGPRSDNSGNFGYNGNSRPKNEYAAQSGTTWSTPAGAEIAEITDNDEVILFDASTGEQKGPAKMPFIIPNVFAVTGSDGNKAYDAVNGNMYFDGNSRYNEYIPADTYVYFTIDDSAAENTTIAATGSANYYYEYWLRRSDNGNTFSYEYVAPVKYDEADGSVMPPSVADAENVHKAKIYIYQKAKANAGQPDFGDFAAIKMESGNLYVRGGTYYSYFGIDNTYCVQATGGLLTVQDGEFYAYENSTCIECAYGTSDIDNRLDVTAGYFYSEGADTVRVLSGTMQVADGVFVKDATTLSANPTGDSAAINMQQGTLSLGLNGGSATFTLTGSSHDAVYSQGGTLNIAGATININKGVSGHSNANGIRAQGGKVTCSGSTSISIDGTTGSAIAISGSATLTLGKSGTDKATFTLNGSSLNGISAQGGSVSVYNTEISFNSGISAGQYATYTKNYGINAEGGTVACHGSTAVSINGNNGAAIRMAAGQSGALSTLTLGESDSDNATFTLNGSSLNGIYSEGGTITAYNAAITFNGSVSNDDYTVSGEYGKDNFGIHTTGGTVTLNGSTSINVSGTASAGIRAEQSSSAATNQINISGASFNCNVLQGSDDNGELSSTAISTIGGNISFAVDSANISSNGLGITVGNGNIVFNPANSSNVALTTPRGTAVYVYGGSIALNEHTEFTVKSTIAQNYKWATGGSNSPNIYNGIYISGGSLHANGTLNVTHHGVENDQNVSGNNAFLNQTVKSFAVRVENSRGVNIAGGEISNAIGGGIYVGGGNVYLGATYSDSDGSYAPSAEAEDLAEDIQVSTTGDIAGNKIDFYGAATWSYDLLRTGGHAVEVSGGSLTVYGGTYSAAQGNGILVRNTSNSVAEVTIENGTFIGRNGGCGKYGANDKNVGPGVFYGLYVVGSHLNVVIKDGIFGELGGESNSGASFYGTRTQDINDRATVNIYKGTFYGHSADAISVFRYININIGKAVQSNGSEIIIQTDNNDAAPLSAQDDFVEKYYNDRGSNINIYYGTFIGGRYDSGGRYNPYLKNNGEDIINEYGSRNTTGDNPDNVKTVFKYPK